jgi:hypothetical protein
MKYCPLNGQNFIADDLKANLSRMFLERSSAIGKYDY